MAWGRKRVLIGDPGQMREFSRYPNSHPFTGSARVNVSVPVRYPNFANASLREAVFGPGDTLYLPAWWWHQFEQPFEDTGALNLWSREMEPSPCLLKLVGVSGHRVCRGTLAALLS